MLAPRNMNRYFRPVLAILIIALFVVALRSGQALRIDTIKLPPGFNIHLYATGVANARQMALQWSLLLFMSVLRRRIGRPPAKRDGWGRSVSRHDRHTLRINRREKRRKT